MELHEALEKLKAEGALLEYTSMHSALNDFYRYLKVKAPKTGYDLEIEGDEDNITVKFNDNVAKVTLEQFDEDEDPMLYVEAGGDERAFYNEHTDYGPAMQFIIKQICPTNEAYIKEDKYMDDMDDELDKTLLLNKIEKALKEAGYKKCGIKKDTVYVWPVDATERYCIVIDEEGMFKNKFYCKVLDREKRRYAAEYYFTIKGDIYKRNGFGGETLSFYGKIEDIVRPGKEYIEDAIKPGFFKRVGKKINSFVNSFDI